MQFTASAFRKLLSIFVFSYFPFGSEGRVWDLIVSVPDHCLSFYFEAKIANSYDIICTYFVKTCHFTQICKLFPSVSLLHHLRHSHTQKCA